MNKAVPNYSVRELLTDARNYLVPMYQRNYAWEEGEINQLLQDVLDYQQKNQAEAKTKPYYIGTLVVFERSDGSLEVIDGQQRFTTLTLIAMCLKRLADKEVVSIDMTWYGKLNLDFESRAKSSKTFTCLYQGVALNHLQSAEYNLDVVNGFALVEKWLLSRKGQLADFCDYLFKNVQVARVSVPNDTDLNHYFEVMNNRGEQLEKHEVVKAQLMSVLNNIADKSTREANLRVLSKVWDSTANMEKYVQYGFTPDERHVVFGKNDWGQFTPSDFGDLLSLLGSELASEAKPADDAKRSLQFLIDTPPPSAQSGEATLSPERFNSVINFSNFLLHVLRILSGKDIPLDDKQLLAQFERHILKTDEAIKKTQDFIFALLKCKYLFDQYIIKREFAQNEDKWSLKRLHFYNVKSQSYINTFDRDEEDGFEGTNRRILMLLSALHVSTPTLVYKHWLNGALYELFQMQEVNAQHYLGRLERLARQFVYGRFLSVDKPAGYYEMIYQNRGYTLTDVEQAGVAERLEFGNIDNNLIFNYLDYLLWCEGIENKTADDVIKQFEFSFRSSVEHFYPQHPMDGHIELGQEHLHRFGNLCLISHSKNSRLSNFQPKAKRDHFKAAINNKNIDTLKLYSMIKSMDARGEWGADQIQEHEKNMLSVFDHDIRRGVQA
ncbi:MAG: DUF262 domain-containing HNH endonuclease family protein [Undibacterium umbellatum]|uniref:DUF262 domain-containing protein n=1 Tax=Undibacterium umbellatum TaxID=2762300 RepID=UPI003BB55469